MIPSYSIGDTGDDFTQVVWDANPSAIVVTNPAGHIVRVNPKVEQLFQWRQDELAGKPLEILFPARLRERWRQLCDSCFVEGIMQQIELTEDLICLRKDGSEFPIELQFTPIEMSDRRFLLTSITDITRRKRSELALKQSAERIQRIVDTSLDAVVIIAEDGTVTDWNPKAEIIFGWPREEVVGKPLTELIIPPRYRDSHLSGMSRFLKTGEGPVLNQRLELSALRRTGEEFPVELTISSVRIGEAYEFSAYLRDISDQTRAVEQAARVQRLTELNLAEDAAAARKRAEQVEERLNLALQSARVGTWNWDVADDLITWDDYIPALFGRETGSLSQQLDGFMIMVHPDDRDSVRRAVQQTVEDGVPYDTEYRVIWPCGSIYTLRARGKVYRDGQGRPLKMTGVCWDITERKQAEERFRATVEAAPTAMLVVSVEGSIVLINRQVEQLFGYHRNELIGQQVEILIPERFRETHPALRRQFFQQSTPRALDAGVELFAVRKDGTEFPVRVGLSPVVTPEGRAVICGVFDITDQKRTFEAIQQAKEAAEASNLAKSSFLANMSHEIRTPMNGIIGMAQLLAQTELRSHQREYLEMIDESAHILLRLLNDILDFSKIEAGRLELEHMDFHLSECVARASQMLLLRAAEKGLEIAVRVAPEIPDFLRGDPGRVQQVLVNLLGNAVKFTESGEIFLNVDVESITDDKVCLHFSVSDTGIGIPAEKLDDIFHAFEQAETSTTRRFGGSGLGLTISRQLVEMMEGRIWVERRDGCGSTFHFTAQFEISIDQHPLEPADLKSLKNVPVLIVDDNSTNRRILSELLQYWQMQPILADSAVAARLALSSAEESQQPIQLILLDHHMPGEDGFQFAESINANAESDRYPIIMISSGSSPVDIEQCEKHGISRYMRKPVVASELLDEVLRQFARHAIVSPQMPPETNPDVVEPRRVLLVEDNEINRRVALGLLRSRGHVVVVALNGKEAVDLLAKHEFDVVLMDMQMPIMDGYEATIAIRKRERLTGGHMPIVAMTAEALKGDREHCLAVGMDDYVSKPIASAAMFRAVEQFPAICLASSVPNLLASKSSMRKEEAAESLQQKNPVIQTEIDWQGLQELLSGGPSEVSAFVELVRTETPKMMAEIRAAIEASDDKRLRRAAHTLKGSLNYFGVAALTQAALELESDARAESLDRVHARIAGLEREVSRFMDALAIGPPENPAA